jgi:hypothetical protein
MSWGSVSGKKHVIHLERCMPESKVTCVYICSIGFATSLSRTEDVLSTIYRELL